MWVKSDEELHWLEERWREHRGEAVGSSQPVLPQIGNSHDTDKLPNRAEFQETSSPRAVILRPKEMKGRETVITPASIPGRSVR